MRTFPDTNVWLSAIIFPGLCSELLARLFEADHTVLTSELIQEEACEVLQRKFKRHTDAVANFELLWTQAACVSDVETPTDDADARLVKAATQAKTSVFVTGDQRVLGWDKQSGIRILSPRDAWTVLFLPAS